MPKKKKSTSYLKKSIVGIVAVVAIVSISYFTVSRDDIPPCANSISCEESLEFKVDNTSDGTFLNQPVYVPPIDDSGISDSTNVLGEQDPTAVKRIYIDLTDQTLSAFEGDELFMKTFISSGRWGRTPTGTFTIWTFLRSTTMSGGEGADYYNLPNVPYVMFFSNNEIAASRGFGIHGTYWHNNFGHPMSHGCINMKTADVKKLYEWAKPQGIGTEVIISGEYEI